MRREAGFSLVGVAFTITAMMLVMGMAAPTWKYVMQNAREEELIFRGTQIAEAIERYQKKHGSPPVSMEALVKGRFLRQAYKDPMVQDGKWRFLRPGEAAIGAPIPSGVPGQPSPGPQATPRAGFGATPSPSPSSRAGGSGGTGTTFGPFIGVASTSTGKSLRVVNGQQRYDRWIFMAGQPAIVGKDAAMRLPPGTRLDNPQPRR